jgi:hypothetical protein
MSTLSIRCIRAALLCLAAGIGLGAWFGLDRTVGATLRPLHAILNLWGWVALLVYGMGYHMLPRFTGRPLYRTRLAHMQSWMAIAAIVLVAAGLIGARAAIPLISGLTVAGSVLVLASAGLFTWLMGELLIGKSYGAKV